MNPSNFPVFGSLSSLELGRLQAAFHHRRGSTKDFKVKDTDRTFDLTVFRMDWCFPAGLFHHLVCVCARIHVKKNMGKIELRSVHNPG